MAAVIFAKALETVAKDQPGVGDVHVASASGGGSPQKRKARTFLEVVNGAREGPGPAMKFADALAKFAVPGLPHPHIGVSRGRKGKGKAAGRGINRVFTAKPGDANPIASHGERKRTGWAHKRDEGATGNLYVHRPVTNADDLHTWAKGAGIPNLVPPEQMHVTQVYSRTPVKIAPKGGSLTVGGDGRKLAPLGDKGAVVMHIASPELSARFDEATKAGASWDYEGGYKPHVTLSYDAGDTDLSAITPPTFPLTLGPEVHEPLNENWAEDSGLRKAWSVPFEFAKADPEQRLIFGWASIVKRGDQWIVDKQGDVIPMAELEKAAYDFVLECRENDDMHTELATGRSVESMVFTPEKEALGIVAKDEHGNSIYGWWTGFKIDSDELWAAHKAGNRPEFSIGGSARREEIEHADSVA